MHYAARIQGLQLSAWEISTCLREIIVETVIVHRVEARLCKKVSHREKERYLLQAFLEKECPRDAWLGG